MRRRLVSISTVALAFIAVFAPPASAQRVLGVGDDALVLPRGCSGFGPLGSGRRSTSATAWTRPGRPNGALEPLGVDFTLDTIGVRQFPNLASLQAGLQSLTGNPNWYATLGNTQVTLRDHIAAFPFVLEAGLTKRFSLAIVIPYVQTHTSTFFNVNTSGIQGNLGFNPAAGGIAAAVTQNTTMYTQFTTAANALEGSIAACQANPAASPSCPALLANQANATALIANSRAFAGGAVGPGLTWIYTTSPFVPIVGTDAQLAIEARVAAFKALYTSFLGAGNPITTNGPFASQNRLTLRDAQRILTESAFGIVADPLTSTGHSHIGDIDIGGKFSVYDSFGGSTEARMSPKGLNFRTAVCGIFPPSHRPGRVAEQLRRPRNGPRRESARGQMVRRCSSGQPLLAVVRRPLQQAVLGQRRRCGSSTCRMRSWRPYIAARQWTGRSAARSSSRPRRAS